MKELLKSIPKSMVKTLIEFAVQSMNKVQSTQFLEIPLGENEENTNEAEIKQFMNKMEHLSFSNNKLLMIAFAEYSSSFILVYSDINLIPNSLNRLLKSQNFKKLEKLGLENMLKWINNDEEKDQMLVNYRELCHEDLYEKLKSFFDINNDEVSAISI